MTVRAGYKWIYRHLPGLPLIWHPTYEEKNLAFTAMMTFADIPQVPVDMMVDALQNKKAPSNS